MLLLLLLLLVLLSVFGCESRRLVHESGQDVTLPCNYDFKYHGPLSVCWGRGQTLTAGCSWLLIATDGLRVVEESRASSRYQMLGYLDRGDVSLTILNVSDEDAGRYRCRVEIPRWSNQLQYYIDLTVITVSERGSLRVFGESGQDVTLPCIYNPEHYGPLEVCWGQGKLLKAGCSQPLIRTDGHKVVGGSQVSSRYQLLGRLDQGDVSLTILNVSQDDVGQYGCRVEIPGLFNDDKHHFDLTVTDSQIPTKTTTHTGPTGGNVTTIETTVTWSHELIPTQQSEGNTFVKYPHVLIGNIVRLSIFIIGVFTAMLLYSAWRQKQRKKIDKRRSQSEGEEENTAV